MNFRLTNLLGCWLAVVVLSGGCSSPPPPATSGTAKGTVTLDGNPLGDVSIDFIPADPTQLTTSALANVDGTFEVELFSSGEHKVTVSSVVMEATVDPTADPESSGAGPAIPEKYADAEKTPLSVNVAPGGTITLELSSSG